MFHLAIRSCSCCGAPLCRWTNVQSSKLLSLSLSRTGECSPGTGKIYCKLPWKRNDRSTQIAVCKSYSNGVRGLISILPLARTVCLPRVHELPHQHSSDRKGIPSDLTPHLWNNRAVRIVTDQTYQHCSFGRLECIERAAGEISLINIKHFFAFGQVGTGTKCRYLSRGQVDVTLIFKS